MFAGIGATEQLPLGAVTTNATGTFFGTNTGEAKRRSRKIGVVFEKKLCGRVVDASTVAFGCPLVTPRSSIVTPAVHRIGTCTSRSEPLTRGTNTCASDVPPLNVISGGFVCPSDAPL